MSIINWAKPTKARQHQNDAGIYGLPGDVFPWDITFDPTDRTFVDYRGQRVWTFRIKVESGLSDVRLVTKAPDTQIRSFGAQSWSNQDGSELSHSSNWWELTTTPLDFATQYSWAFQNPNQQGVYYAPSGVTAGIERLDRWPLPSPDRVDTPDWAQGATIYQIFPDRFANGDPANDPVDVKPWTAKPQQEGIWGGDLPGVTQRMDYLSKLGIDLIYLNPIFLSPSNHRYDTSDYYQVDPILGGNEALAELVETAHSHQIRIMLDVSINHCHPRFFAFADLLENGPKSEFRDWFVVSDWPPRVIHRPHMSQPAWTRKLIANLSERSGVEVEVRNDDGPPLQPTYDTWYGVPVMPRVNLEYGPAREYMTEILCHWIRAYDIDGWRMDVTRYIDPWVWEEIRIAVKGIKPDAYLLAEVFGDTRQWLQGDKFDATMNYTFRDLAIGFFATETIDGPRFLEGMSRLWAQHPKSVSLVNQNLVGSHDTPRFIDIAGNDRWRLHLATIFQLTFPGAAGIYYGDEIGLEGSGNDPGCRGTFPPDGFSPSKHKISKTIIELTQLKCEKEVLRRGEWRGGWADTDAVAFGRQLGRKRLLIAFNRSRKPVSLPDLPTNSQIAWGEGKLISQKVMNTNTLTVGPQSAAIVQV